MNNVFSTAQLVSCTPLMDFNYNPLAFHKMTATWYIPPISMQKYHSIEIYRYVGNLNQCVNPATITEAAPSKKIFTLTQSYDPYTNAPTSLTQITNFPAVATSTRTGILTGWGSFTDDFTVLSPTDYTIDRFHSLSFPSKYNNQTIIEDIGFTRRVIYYVMKSYINGTIDSAPYLLTPDYMQKSLVNHSTKTQVRHDYLHYEGDEIWNSWVADAAQGTQQLYCEKLGARLPSSRCRSSGSVSVY